MGVSYSRDRNRKHQSHIKQLPIDPAYILPSFSKPDAVDLPWSLTSEVSALKSYTPLKNRTPGWIDEKQEVKDVNYPAATPFEVIVDKTLRFPEPSNIEIFGNQAIARVRSTEVSSKPQYQLNVRRSRTFESQRGQRHKSMPVCKESEPSMDFKCGITRRPTSRQSPFDHTSIQQPSNHCDVDYYRHNPPLQSSDIAEEQSQRDIYSRRKHPPTPARNSSKPIQQTNHVINFPPLVVSDQDNDEFLWRNRTSHTSNSKIPRRTSSSSCEPPSQNLPRQSDCDCAPTLGDSRSFQKPNQKSPIHAPQFSQQQQQHIFKARTDQPTKKQPCVSFLSQPSYVPITPLESKTKDSSIISTQRGTQGHSRQHDWLLCGSSLMATPKSSPSSTSSLSSPPSRISRPQKRTTTTITSISTAAPNDLCAFPNSTSHRLEWSRKEVVVERWR